MSMCDIKTLKDCAKFVLMQILGRKVTHVNMYDHKYKRKKKNPEGEQIVNV